MVDRHRVLLQSYSTEEPNPGRTPRSFRLNGDQLTIGPHKDPAIGHRRRRNDPALEFVPCEHLRSSSRLEHDPFTSFAEQIYFAIRGDGGSAVHAADAILPYALSGLGVDAIDNPLLRYIEQKPVVVDEG